MPMTTMTTKTSPKPKTNRLVVHNAIRILMISDIQFDPSYQRPLNNSWRKIVANFNPEALGTPIVGERDDKSLWGVDGQIRITALDRLGKTTVRCEVFASEGPEHEAEVFVDVNGGRVRLTAMDMFQGGLTKQDPACWLVKNVVEEMGFSIPHNRSGRNSVHDDPKTAAKRLVSVSALMKCLRRAGGSDDNLRAVLRTLSSVWEMDPDRTKGNMIEGLSVFCARNDNAPDYDRFAINLSTTKPSEILYSAGLGIGDYANNVADAINKVYHKRITKKSKKK